jgi:hypothetical protein
MYMTKVLTRVQRALQIAREVARPQYAPNAANSAYGIEVLLRCPFCPVPHGDVFIKVEEVIDWMLETSGCPSVNSQSDIEFARRFLLFGADFAGTVACQHLVSALCDCPLYDRHCFYSEITLNYDHPWFAAQGEEGSEFSRFVHEEYADFFRQSRWQSTTPFVHEQTKKWLTNCEYLRQFSLFASAALIYAEQPERFFGEMPARHAASQAYHAAQRSIIDTCRQSKTASRHFDSVQWPPVAAQRPLGDDAG